MTAAKDYLLSMEAVGIDNGVGCKGSEEFEESLKHFCRVCKRRFACGRALGGHMRVHGAELGAIKGGRLEEEFQKGRVKEPSRSCGDSVKEGVQDEVEGLNSMYTLRRNPKRSWRFADQDYSFTFGGADGSGAKRFGSTFLRDSRVCEECGKEFSSWKALFGHMRCHSDRVWRSHQNKESTDEEQQLENLHEDPKENWEIATENSKQNWVAHGENPKENWESSSEEEALDSGSETENAGTASGEDQSSFHRWMKGKRSKRQRSAHNHTEPKNSEQNNEEEDMANCLMMLASGSCFQGERNPDGFQGAAAYSATSGSADLKLPSAEEDIASELQKSSTSRVKVKGLRIDGVEKLESEAYIKDSCKKIPKYECKTCRKYFHTYQALGGHRASHKKVKGCFARITVHEENETLEEEIMDEELLSGADQHLSDDFCKPPRKYQGKASVNGRKEEIAETPSASKKLPRIHECSICHRVFTSGQALGGHKRCHLVVSETSSTVTSTKQQGEMRLTVKEELIDLNMPAPGEDDNGIQVSHNIHSTVLGSSIVKSQSLRPTDGDPVNKVIPAYIQPWWIARNQKQGLFMYKGQANHLTQEDEAESKLGSKNGMDNVQDLIQNRARPWLEV